MIQLLNPLKNSVLKKWPNGDIVQLYGENPQWYNGKGHPGIDIARERGTDVLAAHDGIAQSVVPEFDEQGTLKSKYGNFITILSLKNSLGEQVLTQYAHLLDFIVSENQLIGAGDVIGHEGNSGFVTNATGTKFFWGDAPDNLGNHLHFNVMYFVNGTLQLGLQSMNTVDPMPFLILDPMQYIMNAKGDQYVLFDNPKIAIGIGDVAELEELKKVGLSGTPVSGEVPADYLVYPGIRTKRLVDLFNL